MSNNDDSSTSSKRPRRDDNDDRPEFHPIDDVPLLEPILLDEPCLSTAPAFSECLSPELFSDVTGPSTQPFLSIGTSEEENPHFYSAASGLSPPVNVWMSSPQYQADEVDYNEPDVLSQNKAAPETHPSGSVKCSQTESTVFHNIPLLHDTEPGTSTVQFKDEQPNLNFDEDAEGLSSDRALDGEALSSSHFVGHRLDTSCNLSQVFPPTDPIVQRLLLQEDVSYIHDSGYVAAETEFMSADTEVDEFFDAIDTDICYGEDPASAYEEEENPSALHSGVSFGDEGQQPSTDPLIYSGASVTVSESATALLSFMLSNSVSGELLSSVLSLIQLLLPPENNFFRTAYNFLKHFEHIKTPLNFIFYCSVCQKLLPSQNSVCDRCGPETKIGHYLHFPVIGQLRQKYLRKGFVELLLYRFSRCKKKAENYEDIYDGELYKMVCHLLSEVDCTLSWNADGMSLYKSSNFQVWPIFLNINELAPNLRYKSENIILAGLAFGNEKPNPNLLLKPINQELQLLKDGVEMNVYDRTEPVPVKCILLSGTCDAPAKSLFMRTINFNGFYGCTRCLAKGEKSDESGKVFVYPYQENIEPRTPVMYREHLKIWSEKDPKEPVFGIKGPTYLSQMVWSFFMLATSLDVMHCIYLGCMRQLFYLWFQTNFIKKVFGENAEKKELQETISKLLCMLKAPHYMSRDPRSLKHVKYFKASEFRTFLYCTALPIFSKYMKEPYFENFKKLMWGVGLLNQTSVSPSDVILSRALLTSFVKEFQTLFGLRNMSFNIHCVLHLPDVVLLLGPLHMSSCFGFESLNGQLSRLVHGTRYAGLQIHHNLGLLQNLPLLVNSLANEAVKLYCQRAMSASNRLCIVEKIDSRTFVVGKITKVHIMPPKFVDAFQMSTFTGTNYSFFFRLKQREYFYVCEDYERGSRDSSCVKYMLGSNEHFGAVKVFFRATQCECIDVCNHTATFYAAIERFNFSYPFTISEPYAIITSILSCTTSGTIDFVPVNDLQSVCFKMPVGSELFMSVPLNDNELE